MPEQWELFQKFNAVTGDSNLEETCRMFQHGFRLAVRLIMAGLQEAKKEEGQDEKTI